MVDQHQPHSFEIGCFSVSILCVKVEQRKDWLGREKSSPKPDNWRETRFT